jgi:hypothetical protein
MGQNDYQTPVALVKPFYENLQAPAKNILK